MNRWYLCEDHYTDHMPDLSPDRTVPDQYLKPYALPQLSILPPVEEIQLSEIDRPRWIFYSALDAKTTYELYHALQVRFPEP